MSAPYSAEDARNILEAFVAEFLVDVPAAGMNEREVSAYYAGVNDGSASIIVRDLLFAEGDLTNHVYLIAEDDWFQQIADFATEANEEG